MRWRAFRHSPLGLGLLANKLDPAQTRAWVEPSLNNDAIRLDAVKFLRAAKPQDLLDVSTRLNKFTGPVTIVWGTADRAFTTKLGRRLQHAFGNAHFVEVPNAKTLVSLDAPGQLADAIAASMGPSNSTSPMRPPRSASTIRVSIKTCYASAGSSYWR